MAPAFGQRQCNAIAAIKVPQVARPNTSCRVMEGSASQNAPITRPTFKQAPAHIPWLPSTPVITNTPAAISRTNAMLPTSGRLIVTDCWFIGRL